MKTFHLRVAPILLALLAAACNATPAADAPVSIDFEHFERFRMTMLREAVNMCPDKMGMVEVCPSRFEAAEAGWPEDPLKHGVSDEERLRQDLEADLRRTVDAADDLAVLLFTPQVDTTLTISARNDILGGRGFEFRCRCA